ncbi:hypothetical protein, partial [Klebsiella pneumoniae]|uniref:hypothetical protein n=1 Tax=Klebsiella pneumoniae TaxID=573 RepID=UPI002731FDA8
YSLTGTITASLGGGLAVTPKACVAGFVLPPGAYLRHLHHSDGSSSQGKFNLSDLFSTRNGF